MNTDLPESLTPMLKPLTAFEWPCVISPLLPTAKPEVVNQTKDSSDMNTNLPESSAPIIDSDLSIENWEDRYYRRLGYVGGVSHDVMKTDSSKPEVGNRLEIADLIYTGRMAALSKRWLDTNDNSDTDSVAELEYKTWEFRNALGRTQRIFRRD